MSKAGGRASELAFNVLSTPSFFVVLEATDAENLLEQFEEAASSDYDEIEASPKKTSNIFKAVQNHFAAAAAKAAASGDTSKYANVRRHPRIGNNTVCTRLFAHWIIKNSVSSS